jgi:[ribosomal protein S5]-alanine N-acetyltransferase
MLAFLETERLLLKKVTNEECTERYLLWLHDQDVNLFLESGNFPQTLEDLSNYINSVPANALFLAIYKKDVLEHIGNIKIDAIDFKNGLGEFGIMMGQKEEWGKGYAKEASKVVFQHCFDRLNLRKITLGVVKENASAAKLYEKIGFITEGVLKEHKFYDGAFRDILRMALFKKSYEQ